jgi:hypothetical protein
MQSRMEIKQSEYKSMNRALYDRLEEMGIAVAQDDEDVYFDELAKYGDL